MKHTVIIILSIGIPLIASCCNQTPRVGLASEERAKQIKHTSQGLYNLGKYDEAIAEAEKFTEDSPHYRESRIWIDRVENQLKIAKDRREGERYIPAEVHWSS